MHVYTYVSTQCTLTTPPLSPSIRIYVYYIPIPPHSDQGQQLVINPIQSARLRTTGTFTFKYGRLEVEAKLPRGVRRRWWWGRWEIRFFDV